MDIELKMTVINGGGLISKVREKISTSTERGIDRNGSGIFCALLGRSWA